MAAWPANGDTDWNTKMLAFLAQFVNTSTGALLATTVHASGDVATGGSLASGTSGVSSVKNSTGDYTITVPDTGGSYGVTATIKDPASSKGFANWTGLTATSFKINTYNSSGSLQDSAFSFCVVAH